GGRLQAEAMGRQRAGSVTRDEDVSACGEREQPVASGGYGVVEGDPALRYVQGQPEERALGILDPAPERGSPPGRGTAPRLDLDDVGAEGSEQAPGGETRFAGEVQHVDAVGIAAPASRRRPPTAGPPPPPHLA